MAIQEVIRWLKCEQKLVTKKYRDCRHIIVAYDEAIKALEIKDRLEQADADVYNKRCEVCTSLTICKERGEMCDEASAWEDGYNTALADIRGDMNE